MLLVCNKGEKDLKDCPLEIDKLPVNNIVNYEKLTLCAFSRLNESNKIPKITKKTPKRHVLLVHTTFNILWSNFLKLIIKLLCLKSS